MVELDFLQESERVKGTVSRHSGVVIKENVYKYPPYNFSMGKLDFSPRTLEDKLAIEGLCAVSTLDSQPISKEMSYLVGGFATQSYLPEIYRRGTSDIDLAILRPLNYEEFKEFSKSAVEYLKDHGFKAETKKGQGAYQIIYNLGDDAAVIEFARRNEENFKKREQILRREIQNSRTKIVPGRDYSYRVASPEDISLPKIVRGVGSLDRNEEFIEYIEDAMAPMTAEEVTQKLKRIKELREEATIHVGNPYLSERLRFVSDIFDVRALSQVAGFNKDYLAEAMEDWNALMASSSHRDVLLKYLLPKFVEDDN